MAQTDREEVEVSTEFCKNCGAFYRVTLRHTDTRAHDWYNCAVCGQLLMEWDSSDTPSFTLVLPSPNYPPRKPR
jgi:hypothetical protein